MQPDQAAGGRDPDGFALNLEGIGKHPADAVGIDCILLSEQAKGVASNPGQNNWRAKPLGQPVRYRLQYLIAKAVIERDSDFGEVVKIVKSLDREAIEKWPDERLFLIGAERKPKEEFNYDLKKEPAK